MKDLKNIQGFKILTILLSTFIIKIFFINKLNGFGWEHDEYLHFLDLKTVYTNFPDNLDIGLGVWSKPLFTYIYAIPVQIFNLQTLPQAQILGVVTVLITSYVIYRILLKLNLSQNLSLLGMIIYNFAFLTFRSSLSVMTEPIFALFLSLGILTLLQKKYFWSSFFIGLLVLARMEGLFFVGLWGAYLFFIVCHPEGNRGMKSWFDFPHHDIEKLLKLIWCFILLILPAFIWNFLGYIYTGEILHIFNNGYPSSTSIYGNGGFTYYFESFIRLDPFLFLLCILSFSLVPYYFKKKNFEILLLYFSSALFIALQVVFWRFSLFGTAGLLRYFVTIYPIMTILACLLISKFDLKDKIHNTILISLLSLVFIFNGIITVHRGGVVGWQQTSVWEDSSYQKVGDWVEKNIDESEKLYADFPAYIYFAERDLNNSDIIPDGHLANNDSGIYIFKEGNHRSEIFWNGLNSNNRIDFIIQIEDSRIYKVN